MIFNRFASLLVLRVALITVTLVGMSVTFAATGYYIVTLLLALIAAVLLFELYRYVSKTNIELARFLDAVRNEDFSQRFQPSGSGAGFEQLSEVFGDIVRHFKLSRQQQEENLRHLKSLTEHIPVPLVSLYPDGRVQLHNNAARRLFDSAATCRLEDLARFGESFLDTIRNLEPGGRRLVNFSFDGTERQLTVVATWVVTGAISEKLISMQDIQSELDDVQLHAWQDLVRVLTHEIMNSITPIASLAKTAADLIEDVGAKLKENTDFGVVMEDLEDVRRAVDTVARRSDGLTQFVRGYRSFTLLPAPKKQKLMLIDLIRRVEELLADQWAAKGILLTVKVEPDNLQFFADPDLLEQLLINLLRNAEEVLEGVDDPRVILAGRINQRGHVLLEVADNGPGIPADIVNQIFVPFFTTKPHGSGVGLALTRQIMIAHGGGVTVGKSDTGGAKFTLVF